MGAAAGGLGRRQLQLLEGGVGFGEQTEWGLARWVWRWPVYSSKGKQKAGLVLCSLLSYLVCPPLLVLLSLGADRSLLPRHLVPTHLAVGSLLF